MLFQSYSFIFTFLPLTLLGYFLLARLPWANPSKIFLLLASWWFYLQWKHIYIFLLLGSIIFNYGIARILQSEKFQHSARRKTVFIIGVICNVALLAYFKYADFFITNINQLTGSDFSTLKIILPLAISFFTLQQIAFLVDVYEGLVNETRFSRYALFVSFFPQLIAGPIVHHREMMPQFDAADSNRFHIQNFSLGLFIFSLGLFKKVALADSLALYADIGFSSQQALTLMEAWLSSLAFTFQIYFDFSGYADMAIGLGLMFNILLPKNFDSPYRSRSVIEFWTRWHVTLSEFINAYIYIPLNRYLPGAIGFARAMTATFLALVISGVWHGAAWTFILWGAMHGLALVINHGWRRNNWTLPCWFSWLLTFLFINIAAVMFRAESAAHAGNIYLSMLGFGVTENSHWLSESLFTQIRFFNLPLHSLLPAALQGMVLPCTILLICLGCCLLPKNSGHAKTFFKPSPLFALIQALLLLIPLLLLLAGTQEFIYFQF